MKRLMKKDGFTLLEMMIVLMIISILLLIAIPSMTKSHTIVNSKSCEATMRMFQSQVGTYQVEHDGGLPADLDELISEGYVDVDSAVCPGGEALTLSGGKVSIAAPDAP